MNYILQHTPHYTHTLTLNANGQFGLQFIGHKLFIVFGKTLYTHASHRKMLFIKLISIYFFFCRNFLIVADISIRCRKYFSLLSHLYGTKFTKDRKFILGVAGHCWFIRGVACHDFRWRQWFIRWVNSR